VSAAWQVAFLALAACVLVLALLLVTTMRQVGVISLSLRPTDQGRGPLLNGPAPAIAGLDARTGASWSSKGGSASARVLLFLSLHCESCRTLVPVINQFSDDRHDIEVVAVLPGSRADARTFVDLTGLRVPAICDHDSQAFALYNVSFTPHAVGIDASGRITATTPVKDRQDLDRLAPDPGYPLPTAPDDPAEQASVGVAVLKET
jgi:hypothetical protein